MKVRRILSQILTVLLALQGAVAAQLIDVKPAQAGSGVPEVVINEVMWMGTFQGVTNQSADEWIELFNTTDSAIDVSGWTLSNTGLPAFPSGSVIPARGYFLISNFGANSASSVLNVDPDWVTTSISLANSCVEIVLARSDTTVVDTMGCNGSSYFAGVNNVAGRLRAGMERNIVIGDGTMASSWHTSVGFVNLDAIARGYTFATPKFINDNTEPTAGVVEDGLAGDIDFQFALDEMAGRWSGFGDAESGIDRYLVYCTKTPPPLAPLPNECNASGAGSFEDPLVVSGSDSSATISGLGLLDGETYYFNVIAVSGVNLSSATVGSDGVTVKRLPPANVAAVDTPDDDGGQIDVDWEESAPSDVTYQVHRRLLSSPDWLLSGVTNGTAVTVSGLANYPVSYEFKVVALDHFNEVLESAAPYPKASAIDNRAPSLDVTRVRVNQNHPGLADTVVGLSGASNKTEPAGEVMAQVFNHQPLDSSQPMVEVAVQTDGSFPAVSIGDNQYDKVWLRLVDRIALRTSTVLMLTNDIFGPLKPTLTKVATNCVTEICRVNVEWVDNGPDTAFYHLIYEAEGVERRTFNIVSTGAALDLESGKRHNFTVVAFDAAGNPSERSNQISVLLVRGVRTVIEYVDGQNIVTTEAVPASLEIITASPREDTGELIPKAQAAEDGPEVAEESTRDWARILVIVVLLLVIAISFYALSRSINEEPEAPGKTAAKPATKSKPKPPRGGGRS